MSHGKNISVYLDGAEIEDCLTVDDELGFVVCAVRDEAGDLQIDPDFPTNIWQVKRTGKVEIRFS